MSSEIFQYSSRVGLDSGLTEEQFVGPWTFTDTQDGNPNGSTEVGSNLESSYNGGQTVELLAITQYGIIVEGGTRNYLHSSVQYANGVAPNILASTTYSYCFLAGTLIATPEGEVPIEYLEIGDLVTTEDGRTAPVKWIGEQLVKNSLFTPASQEPVCIAKDALDENLPHTDLFVSADHGMIIDGLVINASALVNSSTIRFVPMAELGAEFIYYHIETEDHDVILANGAAAETFVDIPGRIAFDNYEEYLDLFGAERIIPEMDRLRITSWRLMPDVIKARLSAGSDWDAAIDDPEMTVVLTRGAV